MLEPTKIDIENFKFEMADIDLDDPDLGKYDLCQPKFDGWWTLVFVNNYEAVVVTSGGEIRHSFNVCIPDCVLVCEWIHGTNWAQTHPDKEKFVAFDCIEYQGVDLRDESYSERMNKLNFIAHTFGSFSSIFIRVQSTKSRDWKNLWEISVISSGFEGIVFKNSEDPFEPSMRQGRLKRIATMNYVVMGFKEGTKRLEGTLGAIEGGLIIDGVLRKVCTVGGGFTDTLRDEIWIDKQLYIGKVFEARGKILFSSGALRHPAFTKWRDDVKQKECTLRLK